MTSTATKVLPHSRTAGNFAQRRPTAVGTSGEIASWTLAVGEFPRCHDGRIPPRSAFPPTPRIPTSWPKAGLSVL